jgi:cytochrome P450
VASLSKLPLPPGRRGLPLLGETIDFVRDGRRFALERHSRYGPIFRTHLFGRPTVMVAGAEAVRAVFASEKSALITEWPYSSRKLFGPDSLAVQNGEVHQQRRKILRQAFAPRVLGRYVPEMEAVARRHIERWAAAERFTWLPRISEFAFHIACAVIVGNDSLLDLVHPFETWVKGLFSVPIPGPFSRFGRAMRRREELIERIRVVVQRRLREPEDEVSRDAIGALIRARDENGAGLDVDELCTQMLVLLFAGHDTASSAMTSMCLLLGQHPEVMERLHQEQRALGTDGPLTLEALDRMVYLDQVIKEVLRLVPPGQAGFRKVIQDCEIGGYRIPRGWTIGYQILGTHMRPELYPDPERFDPDRFDPARSRGEQQRFAHIPFGGGLRLCIGMEFARLEMAVLGALLVRDYRWTLAPDQDLTIVGSPVPLPRSGLRVHLFRHDPA